ncbi:hypothetical protein [Candidatus Amarolinea dominans]
MLLLIRHTTLGFDPHVLWILFDQDSPLMAARRGPERIARHP